MSEQDAGQSKKLSYIYILLAGSLWGIISLFLRPLLDAGFTRMQGIVMRCDVAAACLGLYMLLRDRSLFHIRLKDIWCFAGTGIVSLLTFSLCYFYTVETSGAGIAAVLLYTSPAFVLIFSSFLFKEKLSGKKAAALVMTILGCAFVSGGIANGRMGAVNILIGIGSGLFYALYTVFSRCALQRGYKSLTVSFYTFVFCLAGCIPFAGQLTDIPDFDGISVLCALGLGVVSCALPYLFYTKGLEKVESSKAAIIVAVEPVVASAIGFTVFSESFTWQKALGIILVLSATCLCGTRDKK